MFPELRGLIADGRVDFLPGTTIREIRPEGVRVATAEGRTRDIAADAVLLLTGYEQDPTLFRQAGIRLEGAGNRPVLNPLTMESSVKGLFVAGTAVAGTQASGAKEFIETSHVHVERIVAALTGRRPSNTHAPDFAMPES